MLETIKRWFSRSAKSLLADLESLGNEAERLKEQAENSIPALQEAIERAQATVVAEAKKNEAIQAAYRLLKDAGVL